jgi:hypothetical protein
MRPRTYRRALVAVAVVAAVAVWTTARTLFPYHSLNHDEAVYLHQAEMLLAGRLVVTPPVEGVFRPWFFVDGPAGLYPKYAPVPAAVFALGVAVGVPRLSLALVGLVVVALTAGVVRETFDRRTGLVAAVLVVGSPLFLLDTAVFLPYAPTTALNLAFAWAYLRADRTGDRRWAALAGLAVGTAFFARPYTAVLFATPFLVHAAWTLWADRDRLVDGLRGVPADPSAGARRLWRSTAGRQTVTAALGLVGVAVALAYNAVLTGDPLVFPYEAFAPLDGLGFGRRRILSYERTYTPELALRANTTALRVLFTEWVVGGPLGTGLAALGLLVAVRRGLDARRAALAGLFLSVTAGNVYFWGTLNVLGDLGTPDDGLVAALGPYYHFDLLVPTAAFGAVGALAALDRLGSLARARLDPRRARAVLAVALLVGTLVVGGASALVAADAVAHDLQTTRTYERAYDPVESPPEDAVVFLPSPYGPWLAHPFQALRNDPDFDGPTVYALDDRPFAVADAYPDRDLYRYGYRGFWTPWRGSPEAACLQSVERLRGTRVGFRADVGVPDTARSVTARVGTDGGSAYYATDARGSVTVRTTVTREGAVLGGDVRPVDGPATPLAVGDRDTVRVAVFVDYGPAGGFTYRFDLPVEVREGSVRALTPRVEYCRDARRCGGEAAYVPETAPGDVSVDLETFDDGG